MKGSFNKPNEMRENKEALYVKVAQIIQDVLAQQSEKKFGEERLKALGDTKSNWTKNPKESEKWIRTLDKFFWVMRRTKEKKIDLVVFLL